jgi:hypothetical protein
VYFDNVGGDTLGAALSALRVHGRIIACGGISGYNEVEPRPGPPNLFNITTKRLTMKGLIVGDWLDRQAEFGKEVGGYFKAGRLKKRETVAKGIDHAVDAFIGLFQGRNIGKMVVQLACATASSRANSLSISRPSLPASAHLRRFASAEAGAAPLRRARDLFRSVRGRQIAWKEMDAR